MTASCEIEIKVHAVTDKGARISLDGEDKNAVWIARRYVDMGKARDLERGQITKIEIPEWLALKEGLI